MEVGFHPKAPVKWVVCADCGAEGWRGSRAERCPACAGRRYHRMKTARKNMGPASAAVNKAVRQGRLRPAHEFECRDCGKQAEVYDHRDYLLPLEVEPVCNRCNLRRGPGKNRGDEQQESPSRTEAS